MNDRFKFRVWDIEDCSYICRNDFDDIWFDKDGELHIGMYSDFTQGIEDYTSQVIIEQCTGLKDKKGNLIYEGDIVKCDRDFDLDGRVNLTKEVMFTDGTFVLANLDPKNRDFCYINIFHNIKIIGNVHEQAEQKDVK